MTRSESQVPSRLNFRCPSHLGLNPVRSPKVYRAQTRMALAGKVAIVTGGARGIGAGIALNLAKQGAKVAVTYATDKSTARADALVSQMAACGTTGVGIKADFNDDAAPGNIVSETLSRLGVAHIDILVNNAGVAGTGAVEEVTREAYDAIFAVNTRAVFFMTQAVLPHMAKGGRIINVSSTNARTAMANTSVYSGSKVAVEAFTRVLAAELGPRYGVTVTAVNPGPVATDMYLRAPAEVKRMMDGFAASVPAGGRMGTPEDIADVVGFLATDASRWITGNVVAANGGMVMI